MFSLALIASVSLLLLGLWLRRRARSRARAAVEAAQALEDAAARKAEEARWNDLRKRWADYDKAEDARIAALEAEGPPAKWRVRQDPHTGKWRRDEAYLYTPSPKRSLDLPEPLISDIEWAWRAVAGEFDTLEQAQAFTASGAVPFTYLLDDKGQVVKTLLTETDDEDDDA